MSVLKAKKIGFTLCCMASLLIAFAWFASFFFSVEYVRVTPHGYDIIGSGGSFLTYYGVRIQDVDAPNNSSWEDVLWPAPADKSLETVGAKDLVADVTAMRRGNLPCFLFGREPAASWRYADPTESIKRLGESYWVQNKMGTRASIVTPYILVIWIFLTWPLARWLNLWRQKSTPST